MAKSTRWTRGRHRGRRSLYGEVDATDTGSTRRTEVTLWRSQHSGRRSRYGKVDAADTGSTRRTEVILWRSRRGVHVVDVANGGRALAESTRQTWCRRGGWRSCYGEVDAASTGSTRRREIALWRSRRGGRRSHYGEVDALWRSRYGVHVVDAADGGRALAESTRRTWCQRGWRSRYGEVNAADTESTRRTKVTQWQSRRDGHGVDAANRGRVVEPCGV